MESFFKSHVFVAPNLRIVLSYSLMADVPSSL
jgi:hypothetical protein